MASSLQLLPSVIRFLLIFLIFSASLEAREPTIQEVQEVAIRYFGLDRQEMDRWGRRVRWSALLPRFQAGFERELKDVVSLSTSDSVSVSGGDVTVGPDQNDFDQNFNQGTSIEIKGVWALNELVFNPDALAVSRERRDWLRERDRLLEGVTEAYFSRQRMVMELGRGTDAPEMRERRKILLDQSTALLDAKTGGWFSEELHR